MSNNPTATLTRPAGLKLCLAKRKVIPRVEQELRERGLDSRDVPICTRIDDHNGHCCDEVIGHSWNNRNRMVSCRQAYDHRDEKNLGRRG